MDQGGASVACLAPHVHAGVWFMWPLRAPAPRRPGCGKDKGAGLRALCLRCPRWSCKWLRRAPAPTCLVQGSVSRAGVSNRIYGRCCTLAGPQTLR